MRMHGHPLLAPLQGADINAAKYAHILKAFYNFHAQYDKIFSGLGGKFDGELKPLDLLEQDFKALSIEKPQSEIKSTPIGRCFSSYIGYLYLKQGSTLGGQFMSAKLEKNLGLSKGDNLFYFNGYGRQTGEKWRGFLDYLQQVQDRADHDIAVHTAEQLFENMDQMFTSFFEEGKRAA